MENGLFPQYGRKAEQNVFRLITSVKILDLKFRRYIAGAAIKGRYRSVIDPLNIRCNYFTISTIKVSPTDLNSRRRMFSFSEIDFSNVEFIRHRPSTTLNLIF
jgi:hypothetical protein